LPPDQLTIFDVSGSASNEETFLNVLGAVDEHHPSWKRLHIVDVNPDSAILAALKEYGNGTVEIMAIGFVYDRSSSLGTR
jgi:hypothetical protein